MSAAAFSAGSLRRPVFAASAVGLPHWHLALIAVVVGLVFFVTEHNLGTSRAVAYTQTAEEMELAALGGNAVRRIAFLVLAGAGIWLLGQSKQPLKINWWLATPIAAYAALAATSVFWSIDPALCFRRLIVGGCCMAAGLGFARRFSLHELCVLTVALIGPLVLIGLAAELCLGTFRPWAGGYRFAGTVHPNTQGMYLTALALAALGLRPRLSESKLSRVPLQDFGRSEFARIPRRGLWLMVGACLVLALLTKSRTANAATLIALSSVLATQMPWQQKALLAGVGGWLALAALWAIWVLGYDPLNDFREALLLGRAEESDTLSGRAFIWPVVSDFIRQRPWLGYGHESFWTAEAIEVISEELEWGVREAHNGYLEIMLSTGIVGLTLAVLVVVAALAAAVRGATQSHDPAYALPLGMLIFGMLVSAMESGMTVIMLPSFLVGCCVVRMAFFEGPGNRRQETGEAGE